MASLLPHSVPDHSFPNNQASSIESTHLSSSSKSGPCIKTVESIQSYSYKGLEPRLPKPDSPDSPDQASHQDDQSQAAVAKNALVVLKQPDNNKENECVVQRDLFVQDIAPPSKHSKHHKFIPKSLCRLFGCSKASVPATLSPLQPVPTSVYPNPEPLEAAAYWFEKEELSAALQYLEISATQGDPVGLFLAGMSHSHGWGCVQVESLGLRYYRTAVDKTIAAMRDGAIILDSYSVESLHTISNRLTSQNTGIGNIYSDASSVSMRGSAVHLTATHPRSSLSLPDYALSAMRISKSGTIERRKNIVSLMASTPLHAMLSLCVREIGIAYLYGWGIRRSKKTAFELIKVAAELGDPDAQQHLGFLYLHGSGVKKNKPLAAHWYRIYEQSTHTILYEPWIWFKKYTSTTTPIPVLSPDELVLHAVELVHQSDIVPIPIGNNALDSHIQSHNRKRFNWKNISLAIRQISN
ncbi:hypothetical protein BDV3_006221 [Batrachochytrium dendrobatidis]